LERENSVSEKRWRPKGVEVVYEGFSSENLRRCESPVGFDHKLHDWDVRDWSIALMGEVGEAMNWIKKLKREADGTRGNDPDDPKIRELTSQGMTMGQALVCLILEELADIFIYADLFALSLGSSLFVEAVEKFNKTSERIGYPVELLISGRKEEL